jgi:hypothetical protein
MAQDLQFGCDGILYRNTNTFGSPTWNPVINVNDSLSLSMGWNESDTTIRSGSRVVMQEPTTLKLEIGFKMLEDLQDADFTTLIAAFLARTAIDFLACSAAYTEAGNNYVRGYFKVFSMNKAEPINGVNTYDVVLKPSYDPTNLPTYGVTPIA